MTTFYPEMNDSMWWDTRVIFQCHHHAHNVAKWSGGAEPRTMYFLGIRTRPLQCHVVVIVVVIIFGCSCHFIVKFVHPSERDQKFILVCTSYWNNSRALSAGFKMFKCFHLLMLGNVSANVTHSLFVTSTINLNPSTSTLNPFKSVILHKHKMPVNVNL